jgi:hypothetical protein
MDPEQKVNVKSDPELFFWIDIIAAEVDLT